MSVTRHESPHALTRGHWKTAGGVQRWAPKPKPAPIELDPRTLIACPTCRARLDETCKTRGGRVRAPHRSRLVSRRCPCGNLPNGRSRYCIPCWLEERRRSQREYARRAYRQRKAAA